eukprot:5003524-Pyramimonas_sp.AAC.1
MSPLLDSTIQLSPRKTARHRRRPPIELATDRRIPPKTAGYRRETADLRRWLMGNERSMVEVAGMTRGESWLVARTSSFQR